MVLALPLLTSVSVDRISLTQIVHFKHQFYLILRWISPMGELSAIDNKKRIYEQTGLNDTNLGGDDTVNPIVDPSSNSNSAKRFKAVQ